MTRLKVFISIIIGLLITILTVHSCSKQESKEYTVNQEPDGSKHIYVICIGNHEYIRTEQKCRE